ncbi:hypothetical protein HanLR1_Chr17g0651181 [Helianthus annuus]|nr:hypothetical protein HanHA89_Chr06g0211631 [Helianthus annuus]KAJ0631174.1 hypothetical protein HanLR1_Chr17g0651181 [Helianthus annuus]
MAAAPPYATAPFSGTTRQRRRSRDGSGGVYCCVQLRMFRVSYGSNLGSDFSFTSARVMFGPVKAVNGQNFDPTRASYGDVSST